MHQWRKATLSSRAGATAPMSKQVNWAMKILIKPHHIILVPESPTETEAIASWNDSRSGHAFELQGTSGPGIALRDLGPKSEACNEPIAVWSKSPDPAVRLISNFAATPFELDGMIYQSVESFWQSLKFESDAERLRIALVDGPRAKHEGEKRPQAETFLYDGRRILVGTWQHWELMERACWAKFDQNPDAREALLGTSERPLVHRMRRDSRTIPGVIMADIWMRIRDRLRGTTRPAVD
jgi:predicted NAD-dependent protein-ADP-ribosyltransferase YbiA (DUF1768 family)